MGYIWFEDKLVGFMLAKGKTGRRVFSRKTINGLVPWKLSECSCRMQSWCWYLDIAYLCTVSRDLSFSTRGLCTHRMVLHLGICSENIRNSRGVDALLSRYVACILLVMPEQTYFPWDFLLIIASHFPAMSGRSFPRSQNTMWSIFL